MPLRVGGPPDEPVAQARDGVERDGLPRLVGAGALHAATAVRGLALHHRGGLDRHLVRVGELRLKLQHAVIQGLDQVLVEHEPGVRIVGEMRLRPIGAHQLPADEAAVVGLPRLHVHHLAELVHALAGQLADALHVRAQRHAVGVAFEARGVRSVARNGHRAIGKAADLRTLRIAPAIEGEAGLGRGRQRGALPLVEAAEAAHVARLRRGGDGAHRERAHAEHGFQIDIRAHREAVRGIGGQARAAAEPADEMRPSGRDGADTRHLARGVGARSRGAAIAFTCGNVHSELLGGEHGEQLRLARGHETVVRIAAHHIAPVIGPVFECIARKRVGGKARRIAGVNHPGAFHPAGRAVLDQDPAVACHRRHRRNLVRALLEMRHVHVAAHQTARELGLGGLQLAGGGIPALEHVTGRCLRLELDLRATLGEHAAGPHRPAARRACHGQANHLVRLERRRDRAPLRFGGQTLRLHFAFHIKAGEDAVHVPAPEEIPCLRLGLQVQRLAQREGIGGRGGLDAVAGDRAAEPRVGRDHHLGLRALEHRPVRLIPRHAHGQLLLGVLLAVAVLPVGEPEALVRGRLDGHGASVLRQDRVRAGMPLDLHGAAFNQVRISFHAYAVTFGDEHRAHHRVLLGRELKVVGVRSHGNPGIAQVPAFERELVAHVVGKLHGKRDGLAAFAVAVAGHRILAGKIVDGLGHHAHLAQALEAGGHRAVGHGRERIGLVVGSESGRNVGGAVADVPAVEQVALARLRRGGDAFPFGHVEHFADAFAVFERSRPALHGVGSRTNRMGILAVHHGRDAPVAVHAVLAHIAAIDGGAPLIVGFAPLHQLVLLLRVVDARRGQGREREDVAIGGPDHAAFHGQAVAEHLRALVGIGGHHDGAIGLAELRHQVPIDLGGEHVHGRLRDLDAVLEPADERVALAFRGHHLRLLALPQRLHVGRGVAAGGDAGIDARHVGRRGDAHVALEHGRHGHHLGRGVGDADLHALRHGAFDAVLLPAHETVSRVGDGFELGDGALEVDAAATHGAALRRMGGGHDLDRMVAVGLVRVVVVPVLVEDLLDLGQGVLADLGQLLDGLGAGDVDHGLRDDGVNQLAQAVYGGDDPHRAEHRKQRDFERFERLVVVFRHAEMRHQLGVAGQQERVRTIGRRGDRVAQRVGGVVEHVARLGHRVHRHLLAKAVQARGQEGARGVAVLVGVGDAEHHACRNRRVPGRDLHLRGFVFGLRDLVFAGKLVADGDGVVAIHRVPAHELRVVKRCGKLDGLADVAVAVRRIHLQMGIRFRVIGGLSRVDVHPDFLQGEPRLQRGVARCRELVHGRFAHALARGGIEPAREDRVVIQHAQGLDVKRHRLAAFRGKAARHLRDLHPVHELAAARVERLLVTHLAGNRLERSGVKR